MIFNVSITELTTLYLPTGLLPVLDTMTINYWTKCYKRGNCFIDNKMKQQTNGKPGDKPDAS